MAGVDRGLEDVNEESHLHLAVHEQEFVVQQVVVLTTMDKIVGASTGNLQFVFVFISYFKNVDTASLLKSVEREVV
ncbi:hypothetical protein L915_21962 [Phytophthora nicotianae]|uniref:Uncharacterized protein n=1 Tax=Phytophthora nicotianae TaxID=4792 RepID=W2FIU8_PHYNI|nr:hypothetical protein L915_21962 [Phytophthora nicotianae]ETL24128.1 hypothetical protein L916_21860 [Phytophthora nicotianae]